MAENEIIFENDTLVFEIITEEKKTPKTLKKHIFSLLNRKYTYKDIPCCTLTYIVLQIGFFMYNCKINRLSLMECINPDSGDYFSEWSYWTLGCRENNKKMELWRYVTVSLSHHGVVHLTSNCIGFMLMGTDIEVMHGKKAFIAISSLGVVVGLWIFEMNEYINSSDDLLVGSSISLYALIGSRLVNILINKDSMEHVEMYLRICLLSIIIINDLFMYGFFYDPMISYSGHFGGFVGGVCSGTFLLHNYDETIRENKLLKILKLLSVIGSGICGILTYSLPLSEC